MKELNDSLLREPRPFELTLEVRAESLELFDVPVTAWIFAKASSKVCTHDIIRKLCHARRHLLPGRQHHTICGEQDGEAATGPKALRIASETFAPTPWTEHSRRCHSFSTNDKNP